MAQHYNAHVADYESDAVAQARYCARENVEPWEIETYNRHFPDSSDYRAANEFIAMFNALIEWRERNEA